MLVKSRRFRKHLRRMPSAFKAYNGFLRRGFTFERGKGKAVLLDILGKRVVIGNKVPLWKLLVAFPHEWQHLKDWDLWYKECCYPEDIDYYREAFLLHEIKGWSKEVECFQNELNYSLLTTSGRRMKTFLYQLTAEEFVNLVIYEGMLIGPSEGVSYPEYIDRHIKEWKEKNLVRC